MLETTLCYIMKGNEVLLLHRIRKKDDLNKGKWIGVGGKLEAGETPERCLLREVKEETGLELTRYKYRGIVDFHSMEWEERMHLFTADGFEGVMHGCDEGELAWVNTEELSKLPMWSGDRIFLRLLEDGEPFFRLLLSYEGENLSQASLNGNTLELQRLPLE